MEESYAEVIEGEIDLISSMYGDTAERCNPAQHPYALSVALPSLGFVLHVEFPLTGYPEKRHPSFTVTGGPNAVLLSEFNAVLTQEIRDNIPLGQSNVVLLALPLATSLAQTFEERFQQESEEKRRAEGDALEAIVQSRRSEEEEQQAMPFFQSAPICDRKSKFIAHLAPASSEAEAHAAVRYLRSIKDIAAACHPTIWAYRFRDPRTGRVHSEMDDDGETGASGRILFLMEQLGVEGWVVVVTRWFGGILLGPDRFKHIMSVTREVLTQCPDVKLGGGGAGGG